MDLKSNCEAVLDLVMQNLDIENVFEANGNKLMIGSSMFGFDNSLDEVYGLQSLALTNVMILQKHYMKQVEKVLNLVKQIMDLVGEDFLSAKFIRLKDCLGADL